ncbi:MAG: hypothetical protein EPGJADBJ_01627 [Saprospiraceae bacterium]|nr:hypothetical protein [Saprospiraceae bacterium]
MKKTIYLLALLLFLFACQKSEWITREEQNVLPDYAAEFEAWLDLPPVFVSYQRTLPKYLQAVGMSPAPVADAKATLGRVLFYDKNLSLDRSTACASCHKQSNAFSDDAALSTGIKGLQGTRNAMPIANVASFSAHYRSINGLHPLLLWDNRAADVAEQSKLAFLNDHEMGMTMEGIAQRIKELSYYPYLWEKVYGHFNVTEEEVLECLAEFVGAIGSHQSKFDLALEKANGDINFTGMDTIVHQIYSGTTTTIVPIGLPGFNVRELRGRDLFVAHCSGCHSPIRPFLEVLEACNGLDMSYADQGIGALTGNPADNGVFKAPSLRNIQLTAPYMHDGRFKTLEEVVEFYSTGVKDHPNLHPAMRRDNGTIHLNLSSVEKADLIAFLQTLTDPTTSGDERFSNPFRQ